MVKAGQIYRHWKGKTAIVLAVANYVQSRTVIGSLNPYTFCTARSTETDLLINVFYDEDGSIVQNHSRDPLVIYACSGKVWFRSLEEFTQVLGDIHDPISGTMFQRFQLIADESENQSDDRIGVFDAEETQLISSVAVAKFMLGIEQELVSRNIHAERSVLDSLRSDLFALIKSELAKRFRGEKQFSARPKIVCLCGSTRFYKEFQERNFLETMVGNIVLSVGFYPHSSEQAHGEEIGITLEQKQCLDELHKRKIDLADEILVIDVDGYIGESTRSEIEYAIAQNKPIRYVSEAQ